MRPSGQHHEWKDDFLDAYRASGVLLHACRQVGVHHKTVNEARATDPEFLAAFEDAREEAVAAMEVELRRRAVDGVLKPVYQGGQHVGDVREHSDQLLMFALKAARPEVYRETIRVDIRREAERMAEALGMDAADVAAAVEEAERILRDAGTTEASR